MSDRKISIDLAAGLGWIFLASMFIAFIGEPDLIDAIIWRLMNP